MLIRGLALKHENEDHMQRVYRMAQEGHAGARSLIEQVEEAQRNVLDCLEQSANLRNSLPTWDGHPIVEKALQTGSRSLVRDAMRWFKVWTDLEARAASLVGGG